MISANDFFFEIRKRIPALRSGYSESRALQKKSEDLSALYYWILKQLPVSQFETNLRMIDIGGQDFRYAAGLARWARELTTKNVSISSLEVDPYVFYLNLFRRGDAGRFHAQKASGDPRVQVEYISADWLKTDVSNVDFITSFFPFLFNDLHRGFRLPSAAFDPKKFYEKILNTAKLGCVFFHQGKAELNESLEILRELDLGKPELHLSIAENPFISRRYPIEVLWVPSLVLQTKPC